jgi:hypothetical protein
MSSVEMGRDAQFGGWWLVRCIVVVGIALRIGFVFRNTGVLRVDMVLSNLGNGGIKWRALRTPLADRDCRCKV